MTNDYEYYGGGIIKNVKLTIDADSAKKLVNAVQKLTLNNMYKYDNYVIDVEDLYSYIMRTYGDLIEVVKKTGQAVDTKFDMKSAGVIDNDDELHADYDTYLHLSSSFPDVNGAKDGFEFYIWHENYGDDKDTIIEYPKDYNKLIQKQNSENYDSISDYIEKFRKDCVRAITYECGGLIYPILMDLRHRKDPIFIRMTPYLYNGNVYTAIIDTNPPKVTIKLIPDEEKCKTPTCTFWIGGEFVH